MRVQIIVICLLGSLVALNSQSRKLSGKQIGKTLQAISAYIESENINMAEHRVVCKTLKWRPVVYKCELQSFLFSEGGILSGYSGSIKSKHLRKLKFQELLPNVDFRDSLDISIGFTPTYYFSPVVYNPVRREFALQVVQEVVGQFYSTIVVFREEANELVIDRNIYSYVRDY